MQVFSKTISKQARRALLATVIPATMMAASGALAAPVPSAAELSRQTEADVTNYWTPERMQSARSLDLHTAVKPRAVAARPMAAGARQIVHGGFPSVAYDPALEEALPPSLATQNAATVRPQLSGGSGQPFTTNRLYPDLTLYKTYPYSAFGHLFFTTPNGNFQCSASVIRVGVIATAGHCVADGLGHYYTNWMFIPAANGTHAPFGHWGWTNAWTTSAWWSGGGTVPNEQDDAVILLTPRTVRGTVEHVGNYTGYLGYQYNAPQPTAITQVGYPCNLDSCSDPVATYGQVQSGPSNTFLWGTASFGGASGGPEIQDFGVAPSGVPAETLGGNIVIGSTSFTYTATGYNEDGASLFYAPGQNGEWTFGDILNAACATAGAC
jgi:hypothetical protein